MVTAKDPSSSPEFACTKESGPISAASTPARFAPSPPPPPTMHESLLPSEPTIFDHMVRIQSKHM